MSRILGLEHGEKLPALAEALKDLPPDAVVAELEGRGLLDGSACTLLRAYLAMRVFAFRFHAVRCPEAPCTKREVGGRIQWATAGGIFLFCQTGYTEDGKHLSLPPAGQEANSVWFEFCLRAA